MREKGRGVGLRHNLRTTPPKLAFCGRSDQSGRSGRSGQSAVWPVCSLSVVLEGGAWGYGVGVSEPRGHGCWLGRLVQYTNGTRLVAVHFFLANLQ